MKKIVTIVIALILTGIPFYMCHAKFGIGLPSVIKERVEDLDKKVEEKKKAEGNHAPNPLAEPTPANGAIGCPITQDISWSGGDPDIGDNVLYDVYFGDSIPPSLVSDDQSGTTYDPGVLNNNTVYSWKIVAKDSHGMSTTGDVWSFETVIIRNWKTAGLIETDNTGNASNPQVAIGQDGNALAVWYQYDGTRFNIYANRYVVGSGWQTAELIETDNTGSASDPQVAMGQDGNGLAVWRQNDGTRDNIWANRYISGSGWQTAGLIETDNSGHAYSPQVAIGQDGNALAVWYQWDGAMFNIYANRYISGSGWQTAELIETDNSGHAHSPQVAIGQDGNALAVWHQYAGTRYNINANRYVVGSGWQTAGLIETDNSGDAVFPQVAIGQDGNALAVWHQYDGTRNNINANRYVVGSGWKTAGLIETDNSGQAYRSQIAIGQDGNALAVWYQYDGTRFNIYANRYISGLGWQTAGLIETDNSGDAYSPQVAIGQDGNALAVWHQYDGTRNNIWANRYIPGSGWQTAELIETDNTGNAYNPQIAIGQDGNALAVWHQWDGARNNIWANRYDEQ